MELTDCGGFAAILTKDKIDTRLEAADGTDVSQYVFYEAESADNVFSGTAVIANSALCSGGQKVGWIGMGEENALQFNIKVEKPGKYHVLLYYCSGENRDVTVTVNDSTVVQLTGLYSGSYDEPATVGFDVSLKAGVNTIKLANASYYASDFDRIAISK